MSAAGATPATAQRVEVFRVGCSGPGDLSGVQALVDAGTLDPADIVAVMGKTEGNGCVNDFTREYASVAWCAYLAAALDITPQQAGARVALVMSGGTEGVLSPHFTVFTRRRVPARSAPGKRLVVGTAHSRDFQPHELGRRAQIDATAEAVRAAMSDAGILDADDVHFVQVKCPLLTSAKVRAALDAGQVPVTRDTYESMGYSRGATALGVAVALGELGEGDEGEERDARGERSARVVDAPGDAAVLSDWRLQSGRASVSAGIELDANVVLVLGEAEGSASDLRIAHTVMHDAVDAASVRRLLREQFDLDADRDATALQQRLVNLLAKAEASPDGRVRGQRHTMLNDSDINATRHARAVVGGVLASIAGHTALYVSGGAEHQGPPGGGPVAAIVRVAAP
jgi:cyanuric acid amidohydrolase